MSLKEREQLLWAAHKLIRSNKGQLSWLFLLTWAGAPALPGFND